MRHHFRHAAHWYLMFAAAIVVMAVVFSVNGLHDTRVDAGIYADQMRLFASDTPYAASPEALVRLYKPLYAVVGGWLLHADPYTFILIANILLYLLLVPAAYAMLRQLRFRRWHAAAGTIWIITAYPLMKYGLALGTDISGWSFATATVATGLYALRRDSAYLLCLASLIGLVGATAQESGALGLVLLGLLILMQARATGWRLMARRLAALALPAALLYSCVIIGLAGQSSVFSRLAVTSTEYGAGARSLMSWISVEGSSFSLLWILAVAGAFVLWRHRVERGILGYIVAAFVATLPLLLWPIYVSRILFIQFLWVVPLALLAVEALNARAATWPPALRRLALIVICALPVAASATLFALSAGGSLFNGVHPFFGV